MSESPQPQPPRTVSGLVLAVIILVGLVGLFGGAFAGNYATSAYFAAHPQISTVTSSTTNTVSVSQTETSFSTQTLMSTVVSTANGNYYYGNQNYPNYNSYPNYQCQYPYYGSQCYGNGNQYQAYSGIVSQSGSCILFQTSTGTYYLDLSGLNGNPYQNGAVTIYGYIESNYYQGGCGAFPLLYVHP